MLFSLAFALSQLFLGLQRSLETFGFSVQWPIHEGNTEVGNLQPELVGDLLGLLKNILHMTTKESEAEELVKSEGKKRKWAREDNMMASSNGGGIQRYFITLEYVGTRFLGFQKQKGMRTVQGVLEVKSFFLSSWNYLLGLLIE